MSNSLIKKKSFKDQLFFLDLSLMDYNKTLDVQLKCQKLCVEQKIPGVIIFVEHPDTITLGKHCDTNDYILEKDLIAKLHIPVIRTDRGGKITAHCPKQLTIYPIMDMGVHLFPKELVSFLESSTIQVVKKFDIKASIDPHYPGVWIDNRKIAAIGLRIKERVSYHGLSINVSNSLDLFSYILPCGIQDRKVTSLKLELSKNPLNNYYNFSQDDTIIMNEVKKLYKLEFESRLGPLKSVSLAQILGSDS